MLHYTSKPISFLSVFLILSIYNILKKQSIMFLFYYSEGGLLTCIVYVKIKKMWGKFILWEGEEKDGVGKINTLSRHLLNSVFNEPYPFVKYVKK